LISYRLLAPALRLGRSVDSTRLARAVAVGNEDVLKLRLDMARGDSAAARRSLEGMRRARGPLGTANRSADGTLIEARIWTQLGDSAAARAWLDPLLQASWFELMLDRPISVAALMRATLLGAELHDGAHRSQPDWATFGAILWRTSDPELRPLHARATALVKQ
jgi:hypothetical protein